MYQTTFLETRTGKWINCHKIECIFHEVKDVAIYIQIKGTKYLIDETMNLMPHEVELYIKMIVALIRNNDYISQDFLEKMKLAMNKEETSIMHQMMGE